MARIKTQVGKTRAAAPSRKWSGGPAGQRLLARPVRGPTPQVAPPERATKSAAPVNLTEHRVAAIVVPTGQPLSQGSLRMVDAGQSLAIPSGMFCAGFLHPDGSAVKFYENGSGIYLAPAQAAQQFRQHVPAASALLHGPAEKQSTDAEPSTTAGELPSHSSPIAPPAKRRSTAEATELAPPRKKHESPAVESKEAPAVAPAEKQTALQPISAPVSKHTKSSVAPSESPKRRISPAPAKTSQPAPESTPEPVVSLLNEVIQEIVDAGRSEKQHEPIEEKVAEAEPSTDVTPEHAAGMGRSEQVKTIASQNRGVFDREQFKAALRERIAALEADDAESIRDQDKAEGIAGAIKSGIDAGKRAAGGDIAAAVAQTPSAGKAELGTPLPEVNAGPAPQVDASRAVPAPIAVEQVSLVVEQRQLIDQWATADITQEQLQNSNEPTFQEAANARAIAENQAAALPATVRAEESKRLATASADANSITQAGLAGMHGARAGALAGGKEQQLAAKAKYEATRERIADQLGQIYFATTTQVNERMAQLDLDVTATYESGAAAAKTRFYVYLSARLLVYLASGRFVADLLTGGKTKDAIFADGRNQYLADMEHVIERVADIVERGLDDVVMLIAAGRAQLETAINCLGPEEQAIGQEVSVGVRGHFDDLVARIDERQDEMIDALARKYVEAQKDVDGLIELLMNPARAAYQWASEKFGGVADQILSIKTSLSALLEKLSSAAGAIVRDPVGFLRSLNAGVRQGLQNFVDNISTHLKNGFFAWLFGTLAAAGLELPDEFDLQGVLSLVLQVLGLTYANIRSRAVNILGEEIVARVELASEIFIQLVTVGPISLWKHLKERVSSLIDSLINGMQQFLIGRVVIAGVKWLFSLLNPATAFFKAWDAIYDIVNFFIDRGQQIMALVEAIVDSVLAIAMGSAVAVATYIENALAKSLPVAIGFLANLLGLGDLSDRIKELIEKIQEPINKAIDWVIRKAVGLVKSVGKKMGFGKEEKKTAVDPTMEDVTIIEPFGMAGESHTLTAIVQHGQLQITVASAVEMVLQSALSWAIDQLERDKTFPKRKEILKRLERAYYLADYNNIIQEWHDQQQPGQFPRFLKRRVLEIVASLSDLGRIPAEPPDTTERRIHSLHQLFAKMRRGNGKYSYLPDPDDVAPFQDFTDVQRIKILAANRRAYGIPAPFAISELSGAKLNDAHNREHLFKPNIDHIYPRSAGGTNSYSNARVLARHENVTKGVKITEPHPFTEEQTVGTKVILRRTRADEASLASRIKGFRGSKRAERHAIDQVINRRVSPQAILDAVKNPTVVVKQPDGRTQYLTKDAAVVVDSSSQVITAWAGVHHDAKTLERLRKATGGK